MDERNPVYEMLSDRLGVAFGEFPDLQKFRLLNGAPASDVPTRMYNEERVLESVTQVDFALLDYQAFFLSNINYVLKRLSQKLVNHGLIVLYKPNRDTLAETAKIVQRLLMMGSVEFLSSHSSAEGNYYVFRHVRPQSLPATVYTPLTAESGKPLRYKWADAISVFFSRFPVLKGLVKRMLRA